MTSLRSMNRSLASQTAVHVSTLLSKLQLTIPLVVCRLHLEQPRYPHQVQDRRRDLAQGP
jgi:hypothetical protein